MSGYQEQFITYYFEYMRKQLAANLLCDAIPPLLQKELAACLYKCTIAQIKNLFIHFKMSDGQPTIDPHTLEAVYEKPDAQKCGRSALTTLHSQGMLFSKASKTIVPALGFFIRLPNLTVTEESFMIAKITFYLCVICIFFHVESSEPIKQAAGSSQQPQSKGLIAEAEDELASASNWIEEKASEGESFIANEASEAASLIKEAAQELKHLEEVYAESIQLRTEVETPDSSSYTPTGLYPGIHANEILCRKNRRASIVRSVRTLSTSSLSIG